MWYDYRPDGSGFDDVGKRLLYVALLHLCGPRQVRDGLGHPEHRWSFRGSQGAKQGVRTRISAAERCHVGGGDAPAPRAARE